MRGPNFLLRALLLASLSPLERENLADKAEYAAVLKEQKALFEKLLPHLPQRNN